jgi:cytochrome b561
VLAVVGLRTNPIALAGLAAGLPVGAVLGRIAIGKTRFDQVGTEFFFTPHAPIGFAVALLFMARMAWRAYEFFALGSLAHHEFVSSPLTLVIFGVLAGYYMSYAFGLLSWRKRTAPVSP